jgi:cyclophilin family peptidyl-prolyl cis-trans isomerase
MTKQQYLGIVGLVIALAVVWFFLPGKTSNNGESKKATIQHVILKTTLGDIPLDLYVDKAPKTVKNFVDLAKADYYDGVKFHRVMKDFMIQSGDQISRDDTRKSEWGFGGPGYTFEDEINSEKLIRGVLAMANGGPNTNGSQFFIVTAASTPWLDGKHTVFGRVSSEEGLKVMSAIENVKTTGLGDPEKGVPADQPLNPPVILDVVVE